MRTLTRLFGLILATTLFLSANTLLAQDAELLRHFDYDQKAPLGIGKPQAAAAPVVAEPAPAPSGRRGSAKAAEE